MRVKSRKRRRSVRDLLESDYDLLTFATKTLREEYLT